MTGERRISNLPPYAVQMEPVVQYSQKDPLYDPNLDNLDDTFVNQNELYAQPKILNIHDQTAAHSYGPPYGSLPTAPLYSHEPPPHYYEAPEPIIEIIIKESNESLPAPPLPPPQKQKKEPVHVFYVKYSKDPHNKDKVVYEKPIPAVTPPSNQEEHDDHHNDYVTVTPEPYYAPQETTTLRAIIKPESEIYHSDSNVKISFGNERHHYNSDRRGSHFHSEDHEESAPKPAIAYPQQGSSHPPLERSASSQPQPQQQPRQQSHQQPHSHPQPQQHQPRPQEAPRPPVHPTQQTYRLVPQHAQSRIQFQPPYLANEQLLPRQGPSVSPFRAQSHIPRQNPFGLSQVPTPHFSNSAPTVPGPGGPPFPNAFPRPSNGPFLARPSNPPPFGPIPNLNGPPRPGFHSGPPRPFPQSQSSQFFDEPKYLQENYHTITTDQVDPTKEQLLPNKPRQTFNLGPRPNPSPIPAHFQEDTNRPQIVPFNQQLPHQRPHQHFTDSVPNKPSFSLDLGPSRQPFFNLKPLPPQIDDNRHIFQQQQQAQLPQQPPFSFHPGPRPTPEQPHTSGQSSFLGPIEASPSPSAIPQTQFLPQPSAPTLFNFHPQPSPTPEQQFTFQSPERPQFSRPHGPSERPPLHQSHGPSERPPTNVQDQFHQQNVGQFVPNGGELVASIPKYEQHITVSGPTAQPNYRGLNEPTPTANHPEQQYQQHQQNQQHQQQQQNQQHTQHQQNLQHQQRPQQQIQPQQVQAQQQFLDPEQEQVRFQLAQNVKKQQEEIQRLQTQLLQAQQQHHQQEQQQIYKHSSKFSYNQQIQATSPRSYTQERSNYVSSTSSPPYYQPTSRTVEINPTTQKYSSSTLNSINSTPEAKKEEKKKQPAIELPDEVPDDLRQQLLSSGILDNADISILDYDKVGETPLDSLPPDQLANFFSAGGGQQLASSENRPVIVSPEGDRIQSRIDDEEDDQEIAASENIPSYVAQPQKQAVEMKIVHFDPKTAEGQNIAKEYVKDGATRVDPVALNDKKYNRYLPLKVSGNQFPLPDILKGRKITSVVVLAPVETEILNGDHNRKERAASKGLKGIKFIAGDSLQDLLKKPTKENYKKWLDTEKNTATDLQSVILLVTG